MRFLRRPLILGIITLLLAGSGLAVYLHDQTPGSNPLAPQVTSISQTQSGYGFSTSLVNMTADQLNTQLDALHATGATWVRFDLSWNEVQYNGPQSYNWARYDIATQAARAHGFKVLMIVDFVPPWAREKNCTYSEMCAPASSSAYGTFAGLVAKRYSSYGVQAYEIWNEPNIYNRFLPAANPGQYTDMLKHAYTAIKAADANAVVIAASCAPSETDASNRSPSDFVTQIYAAGAKGYFDAISMHPYTYPDTPDKSNRYDAWGQLSTTHTIMAAHGDGAKQIWITEFGAPTNGPNRAGDHVSEDLQATIATQGILDFRKFSWAGPLFWYDYQDSSTDTSSSENFYGLVRADGSFKPAYAAFVNAIKSL